MTDLSELARIALPKCENSASRLTSEDLNVSLNRASEARLHARNSIKLHRDKTENRHIVRLRSGNATTSEPEYSAIGKLLYRASQRKD